MLLKKKRKIPQCIIDNIEIYHDSDRENSDKENFNEENYFFLKYTVKLIFKGYKKTDKIFFYNFFSICKSVNKISKEQRKALKKDL